MQKRKIKNIQFYFSEHVIVMLYNTQYIAFHSYGRSNKRALRSFGEKLQHTRKIDLNLVFRLAREHNIPSMAVTEAVVHSFEADHDR